MKLWVLDVGHGNCSVLTGAGVVLVFDAACGATLDAFVDAHGIAVIDAVYVSHADADHIAGLIGLFLNPKLTVKTVHINPDKRDSLAWRELRIALSDAKKRAGTTIVPQISTTTPPVLVGNAEVRVLAPAPEEALGGVGGRDLSERRMDANTLSAVILVSWKGTGFALLAGDMDHDGLQRMLADGQLPKARILVSPHHGGLPGKGDAKTFAGAVAGAVEPDLIVFSIGRGRHGTPRPEVVDGMKAVRSGAYVMCTQLSERCRAAAPSLLRKFPTTRPARGAAANLCCAGTIEIDLDDGPLRVLPGMSDHVAFVQAQAPSRVCNA
jgi:beta-lactamase superfamily II metal-dependent hydrolase